MSQSALATIAARSGAVLIANSKGWQNSMQIRSGTSNKLYTVAQRTTSGEWGCSCLGYITSSKRRPEGQRGCKHLDAMLPMLKAAFSADSPVAPKKIG